MALFKTPTGIELEIRLATNEDISAILYLNNAWTISSLENADKENGFLFCERYERAELKKIIHQNELGIATYNGRLIAYYINDNFSSLIDGNKLAIDQMKASGAILPKASVSARTQIVVDRSFHRMGVPKAIVSFLKPFLAAKYDLLFSIGRNDNIKRIAHEKAGWEVVYENELNYYCIYDLKK